MPDEFLIEKSWRGVVEVLGEDSQNFLHRMLTQDIQNLKTGEGAYAAFLAAAGKILADMNVYIFQDKILLEMENGLTRKLINLLDKFLIAERATLADVSEKFSLVSLRGKNSQSILESFCQGPLNPMRPFQHWQVEIPGTRLTIIRYGLRGESGFDLLLPQGHAEKIIRSLLDQGQSYGLIRAGLESWEILRLEAGILRYGIDMDDQILLPETGLEYLAASETKGCYPGQEVVARMKTYGGHQKKMAGLIFGKGNLPSRGDKIYRGDKETGWITSAGFSPALQNGIALAYLQKGFFEPGLEVEIRANSGKISAKTTALPFISS